MLGQKINFLVKFYLLKMYLPVKTRGNLPVKCTYLLKILYYWATVYKMKSTLGNRVQNEMYVGNPVIKP